MIDKLKELNLRLTELSNYLKISRPTLYKYIDDFEKKRYSKIDYDTLELFKYIKLKTTLSKLQVIDYILHSHGKNKDSIIEKVKDTIDSREKEVLLTKLLDIFKHNNYEKIINDFIKKTEVSRDD